MAIMAVTALNRLNLSIAGKYIEEEFAFNTISMGRVFSAFLWGYGLFQIPWGYICDRIGPRRTLTASIFCFGVGSGAMVFAPRFAAATGISALAVFRIVRFLTGVGEAAVSSNVTRVIASWTALRERGFASGLQVCGLGLGGTIDSDRHRLDDDSLGLASVVRDFSRARLPGGRALALVRD